VVGASGYAGAEVLRLLAGHPSLRVEHATAESNAGAGIGELYPSLAGAYPDLVLGRFDATTLAGADVVFLALPHGESQRLVPELLGRVGHVVDLGADFRLPAGAYARWYGAEHGAPELLGSFAFGIPELFPDDVAAAANVASPGCYPTAAALALAPLVAAGMIDGDVTAYGLLDHRHTGEIEFALARVAARHGHGGPAPGGGPPDAGPVRVLFTPHLVPMVRGIFATCHARPAVEGLSTASLVDHYRAFYDGCPFVVVADGPPHTKATAGSNAAHLTVRFDERTGRVLALAALDNLGKGAAGQAVQNANLLLGLDEGAGLTAVGIWP